MATKVLNCRDCKVEFAFAEGEQFFFGQRLWPDPVRCKECRKENSQAKQARRLRQQSPAARVRLSDALAKLLGGNA
jgi:putative zinc ribbon protein